MTPVERRRCAVLGAGGYIGQHFVRLLADHPWFEPVLLTSTARSDGRRLEELWQLPEPVPSSLSTRRLRTASPADLRRAGVDVAFSALPSHTAGAIESGIARQGIAVFSNAADHRMDSASPLLVPEVNAGHLNLARTAHSSAAPIICNPNCSATGLVLALAPLAPLLRPRRVHVATYQALSGAGFPGVPSLAIEDNVLPFIAEEEEKIRAETRRILGRWTDRRLRPAPLEIFAHCARVAVRDGHLEAVTVEAGRRPTEAALRTAWSDFDPLRGFDLPTAPHPPVECRRESDRPQPLRDRWAGSPERARGMAAVVGRVRWEPPFLRFFVLSHNAVRGGAGGSVLNAELAARVGLLAPTRQGVGH